MIDSIIMTMITKGEWRQHNINGKKTVKVLTDFKYIYAKQTLLMLWDFNDIDDMQAVIIFIYFYDFIYI